MSHRRLSRWALSLCVLLVFAATLCAEKPATRIVGYYPMWATKAYPMSGIPADRLTHVLLAFAHIDEEGQPALNDEDDPSEYYQQVAQQVEAMHERFPDLRVSLSIGGWDWSDRFSEIAADEGLRQTFADGCLELVKELGVDGIDLAWEFPVTGGKTEVGALDDRENLTHLLESLRQTLASEPERVQPRQYLISCAISAAPEHLANIELDRMHPYCDWINVMAYDLWGSWSDRTGHHAPLRSPRFGSSAVRDRSAVAAVARLREAGIPDDKIVIGIPCYGRGVKGARNENFGMYQRHRGPARGTWGDETFAYNHLVRDYFSRIPSHWDQNAGSGWMYDRRSGLLISFEDSRSAALKAEYVRTEGLGGVMLWELTMDTADEISLLTTVHDTLTETSR